MFASEGLHAEVNPSAFSFMVEPGQAFYVAVRYSYKAPGAENWEHRLEFVMPPGIELPPHMTWMDWPTRGEVLVRSVSVKPLPGQPLDEWGTS